MGELAIERKTKTRKKIEPPKKYAVYILNDDYTTWDFVILTLMKIFHKTQEEAEKLTHHVHHNGKGLCGIYPKEIAETKVNAANEFARMNRQPLRTIMKPYEN